MSRCRITRKLYKDIKKYDHAQMEEYLTSVYVEGYQKGKDDALTTFAENKIESYQNSVEQIEAIEEELKSVKGIGETKRKAVMDVVLKVLKVEAR